MKDPIDAVKDWVKEQIEQAKREVRARIYEEIAEMLKDRAEELRARERE